MGKLILTSGGYLDGQRGEECDEIIEKYSKGKNVLIIDNATLTGSNVKGLPVIYKNFKRISRTVAQMSLTAGNLTSIFKYDVVYITGGDLAPFISLIQEHDLSNAFVKFLKNDGVVIGESVGSIIFGKDFKWLYDIKKGTKPKYDVAFLSYKGMGLVDINFFPHWNKASGEMRQRVLDYEKLHGINISCVEDGEFFIIDL